MGGGRKGCHPLQLGLFQLLAGGVGLQKKSVRAEVLTSTVFPRSVPVFLGTVTLAGGDLCLVRGTRAVV